mgnify:FL=1
MKLEKKKMNFSDDRGTITDIFSNEPREQCTIISSKKGSVRGNHFHKHTLQSDFMVSGKMKILYRKQDESEVHEQIVEANDFLQWEAGEAHEFIAVEDLIFVTFHNGPRGGDNYENDTFRLKIPLHEQAKKKITDWSVQ